MKRKKVWLAAICACLLLFVAACGTQEKVEMQPVTEAPATEAPPEPFKRLKSIRIIWLDDTELVAGESMIVNSLGQLTEFWDNYTSTTCEYDEAGRLKEVNSVRKSDGIVGNETWQYQSGLPASTEYNPNNGFTSARVGSYSVEKNESGQISAMVLSEKLIPADGGASENTVTRFEYEYDEQGNILQFRYYSDGKMDHITHLTYDEEGNLLSFYSIGASNGEEYLRLEFDYEEVDGTEGEQVKCSNFISIFTWDALLTHLL